MRVRGVSFFFLLPGSCVQECYFLIPFQVGEASAAKHPSKLAQTVIDSISVVRLTLFRGYEKLH